MIKGKVINDKKRDTIVEGIESKWIIGDGSGPGHPTRGFLEAIASLEVTFSLTHSVTHLF